MVARAFNPCTQEAEARSSLSLRPFRSTVQVLGQRATQRNYVSKQKQKQKHHLHPKQQKRQK